ncbi:hypothetical protein COZ61_01180 [Candidatus Berkelbacteria bacterium CG_4_8_14_3_um_filter_33_6]|nr:MAG: hypothetical protein COX10_01520 [Candidatus Berkelbacteria bacterium CG23_combo_of_CG06-09_8_20_14_all_33_15]PIS08428.1 MAG: hypothetical protein COT76_01495 [Candidatus Berkelbacteria bacterium CG10_big_fil_rev_8_21_14_0_10_33_10]PIX31169.1 MAG: hypothetical protein COZ61_01180 [Candidatus Berkelbacteria bacterium CG_4_8_14_3_um_filter_33_6]PIZ28254.1 MAG: hypothetical protein COY43_01470 [Candidatus Berkelbacteria bacterium CG_4_10_14_0_8_um_filter_35_9_33_8]
MNPTNLKQQTKEIIDNIPTEKLGVVLSFLRWVDQEDITSKEWTAIEQGENEIKDKQFIGWRKIARTI